MSREQTVKPKYLEKEYWDKRFQKEEGYDWLVGYEKIKEFVAKHVQREDRILMLGCGSSSLSEQMYNDGYERIVNVDFSSVCIEKMCEKCRHCPGMEWLEMDIKDLKFPEESFDVVVEKATVDSLLTQEKDVWRVSDAGLEMVDRAFAETSRVLKLGGRFISITFAQPHFRRPLLAVGRYDWSVDLTEVEGYLPFFCFIMVKGQPLSARDVDLEERTTAKRLKDKAGDSDLSEEHVTESPEDAETFLAGFNL